MNFLATQGHWLSLVFAFLMGLAILLYVILDGYDLGVGMLMFNTNEEEKDTMIASIGPFWDANETWLVLGVGILLVAFPFAHGKILTALYLPATTMLIMLILRGVSFDFRTKVQAERKPLWNKTFFIGSLGAALAQGFMLGQYIMGFEHSPSSYFFSGLAAVCTAASYCFIGACWLIMKTEGELQSKSIRRARVGLWLTAFSIGVVSISTPAVNEYVFEKWFAYPNILLLAPIPILTAGLIILIDRLLKKMPLADDRLSWLPFVGSVAVFILCFIGLCYSFYPYIILGKMTIYESSTAPESLMVMLVGVVVVLPCILGYTFFSYRVFWGKARGLTYY